MSDSDSDGSGSDSELEYEEQMEAALEHSYKEYLSRKVRQGKHVCRARTHSYMCRYIRACGKEGVKQNRWQWQCGGRVVRNEERCALSSFGLTVLHISV